MARVPHGASYGGLCLTADVSWVSFSPSTMRNAAVGEWLKQRESERRRLCGVKRSPLPP